MVVDGANEFRASENRARLARNGQLNETARLYAEHLANGGDFSHESDGTTPEMRVRRQGYRHCVVTENLARHYNSAGYATGELARLLVQGWKDSPSHRRNMLEPDALETGIAVVHRSRGGAEYFYAVQLYARNESTEVRFRVRNRSDVQIGYSVNGRAFTLDPNWGREHSRCARPDLHFQSRARGRFEPSPKDCYVVPASGDAVKRASGECE